MEELLKRIKADPPDIVIDTTAIRLISPTPGELDHEPGLLLEAGLSLAEEPDENHPKVEGRVLSPLKRWMRERYGGQERVDDLCTVYYLGRPWREWHEYLSP